MSNIFESIKIRERDFSPKAAVSTNIQKDITATTTQQTTEIKGDDAMNEQNKKLMDICALVVKWMKDFDINMDEFINALTTYINSIAVDTNVVEDKEIEKDSKEEDLPKEGSQEVSGGTTDDPRDITVTPNEVNFNNLYDVVKKLVEDTGVDFGIFLSNALAKLNRGYDEGRKDVSNSDLWNLLSSINKTVIRIENSGGPKVLATERVAPAKLKKFKGFRLHKKDLKKIRKIVREEVDKSNLYQSINQSTERKNELNVVGEFIEGLLDPDKKKTTDGKTDDNKVASWSFVKIPVGEASIGKAWIDFANKYQVTPSQMEFILNKYTGGGSLTQKILNDKFSDNKKKKKK